MRKSETAWKCWRHLFLCCCVGVGLGSLSFLVSCQPEEDSSSPQTSGAFSPTKPVGSTTLSHGGPQPTEQSLNRAVHGFRIGQRVYVRGPMGRTEQSPVPLLSGRPGTSGLSSSQAEDLTHELLTGTRVTILELRSEPFSDESSHMAASGKRPKVYYKVQDDDGVQGWVSEEFLVRQKNHQGEK